MGFLLAVVKAAGSHATGGKLLKLTLLQTMGVNWISHCTHNCVPHDESKKYRAVYPQDFTRQAFLRILFLFQGSLASDL